MNLLLRLTSYQQQITALAPMTSRGITGRAAGDRAPKSSNGRLGRLVLLVLG